MNRSENPLLVKRQPAPLDKLRHWNRRLWQEFAILKKRVEILEESANIDTGGEFWNAVEENPWEPHIVYLNSPYIVPAFLAGIILGIIVGVII